MSDEGEEEINFKEPSSLDLSSQDVSDFRGFIKAFKQMEILSIAVKMILLLLYPDIFAFYQNRKEVRKLIFENLPDEDRSIHEIFVNYLGVKEDDLESRERSSVVRVRDQHKEISLYVDRCFRGMAVLYGVEQNKKYCEFVLRKAVCILF